ncbi:MAG: ABC transporter substrate-binding protein, partial [Alphaproteobacteria bacterium]|nr:ABC transporter substrate-binding protein [Alphaproteobacteria bacterium]
MWTRRAIAGAAAGACLPGGDAPRRVVSLNPCLDVILVHIADRTQIAALSHYARDASSSTIADIARTLPFTYESAEEILSLDPDLVLASTHSALAT